MAARPSLNFFNWALSLQLGEQLAQLVPASGVDVVELEDEGTCVRFSPLMTSAGNIHFTQSLVKTEICHKSVHQSPGVKADILKKVFTMVRVFFPNKSMLTLSFLCALVAGALEVAQLLYVTLPR